jgi:hypothetical protein
MLVRITIDDLLERLRRDGYYVSQLAVRAEEAVQFVLDVGQSLGELYVPKDCEPSEPVIRTAPTRTRRAAPFDRPESIGWHGDFATYEDRPEISLVYITRPDPRGGDFGAWRLASVERVIGALRGTEEGRASFDFLTQEQLPFSYADNEAPRWFRVIESRPTGKLGLRFYLPSVRRGCCAAYGKVPPRIAAAVATLERAADAVGEIVPTREGSLLIASNWHALHDRVQQTISRRRPNREALLCFVARHRSSQGEIKSTSAESVK